MDGVVEVQGKSLKEELDLLAIGQRNFLLYRILGLNFKEAAGAVEVSKETPRLWRRDVRYKGVEDRLKELREKHLGEARAYFFEILRPKAMIILNKLLDKGLDWKRVGKEDKVYVMKACELVLRLGQMEGGSPVGSYEELLVRARRVNPEAELGPGRRVYLPEVLTPGIRIPGVLPGIGGEE